MWSFDVFFDVDQNKVLNKQSSFRLPETTLRLCDAAVMQIRVCYIVSWYNVALYSMVLIQHHDINSAEDKLFKVQKTPTKYMLSSDFSIGIFLVISAQRDRLKYNL